MKLSRAGMFVLAVGLTVMPVLAQAQDAPAKSTASKPAPSASQAVLASWNEIGRKLVAMAEDFPEDKYDFKPTPAQRSFAEQLEKNEAIKVYAKLPGWFRVPTPLGPYNPDWAVPVKTEDGERLYLVM